MSHRTAEASTSARVLRSAGLGAILLLTAAVTAVGCSGDSNSAAGGTTGGAGGSQGTGGGAGSGGAGGGGDANTSTDCAVRTDVDIYTANMTKKGTNGLLSFLLIQSDPGPPILGKNIFKLKVTDANNMPVAKGLTVSLFMPEHGHTSPLSPVVTYDDATGTYTLNPMYLSMGGKWRVTFSISDPNDDALTLDKVDFFFCVA